MINPSKGCLLTVPLKCLPPFRVIGNYRLRNWKPQDNQDSTIIYWVSRGIEGELKVLSNQVPVPLQLVN